MHHGALTLLKSYRAILQILCSTFSRHHPDPTGRHHRQIGCQSTSNAYTVYPHLGILCRSLAGQCNSLCIIKSCQCHAQYIPLARCRALQRIMRDECIRVCGIRHLAHQQQCTLTVATFHCKAQLEVGQTIDCQFWQHRHTSCRRYTFHIECVAAIYYVDCRRTAIGSSDIPTMRHTSGWC